MYNMEIGKYHKMLFPFKLSVSFGEQVVEYLQSQLLCESGVCH